MDIEWPDAMRVDLGLVGGGRLAGRTAPAKMSAADGWCLAR